MAHNKVPSTCNSSKVFLSKLRDTNSFRFSSLAINSVPLDKIVGELVRVESDKFLRSFIRITKNLKGNQIDEFEDACKSRVDEITRLSVAVMQREEGSIVTISKDLNHDVQYSNWPKGITLSVEGVDIYSLDHDPRCYRHLFNGFYIGLGILRDQYDSGRIEDEDYDNQVRYLCIVISSIANVYLDLRGNKTYNTLSEKKSFSRLTQVHKLDKTSDYWITFLTVCQDIEIGRVNPRQSPRYVRSLLKGIRLGKSGKEYTDSDYSISMRSSNTFWEGTRVPALYASLIESPTYKPSVIPGYDPDYRSFVDGHDVKTSRVRSISIEGSKLSRRIIHIFDNEAQDRMNYFHNRLSNILRHYNCDCTFDQSKGVRFAKELTLDPGYRNIYSLDISKATDTLSQEFQNLVISMFFNKEMVDEWFDIVSMPRVFTFSDGSEVDYVQTVGQPQGVKSSFPAFAMVHHIILLMLMKHEGLEDMEASDFYRVLGDDSIFSIEDGDLTVRNTYIDICKWVNWEVNPLKGYTYRMGVDVAPIAEFAKERFVNGLEFSPIPIKMLLNTVVDDQYHYLLRWWSSKHVKRQSLEWFIQFIFGEIEDFNLLTWTILCQEGLGIAKDFNCSSEKFPDDLRLWVLSTYFLRSLEGTLLDSFVPSRKTTKWDHSKWSDPFLNSKWEKLLLPLNGSVYPKYLRMVDNNEDIILKLDSIFGQLGRQIHGSSVAICFVDNDTKLLISSCLDIIGDLASGTFDIEDTEMYIRVLMETNKVIQSLQPRGDTKAGVTSWDFMENLNKAVKDNILSDKLVTV